MRKIAIVLGVLSAFVFTHAAQAWYHHPVTAPVAMIAKIFGGGSAATGAAVGGAFVGGVGIAALVCGLNQPKRGSTDTWTDNRARLDYDGTYNAREDGCIVKKKTKKKKKRSRDPKPPPVSVRW